MLNRFLNRMFIVIFLAIASYGSLAAENCSTNSSDCCPKSKDTSCYCLSRTVFIPRSISQDSVYELASNFYNTYYAQKNSKNTEKNNENPKELALAVEQDNNRAFSFYFAYNWIFQKSNSSEELAKYFLPGCQKSIYCAEDGSGDVNPLWFNVIGEPLDQTTNTGNQQENPQLKFYRSRISLCPERKTFGAQFYLNGYITDYLWARINTAVVYATHELHICEGSRQGKGAIEGFENMIDGLRNSDLCFQKFCPTKQEKIGLDDIQFKLGYDFLLNDDYHLALYLRGTAPTGRRSKNKNIFEPIIGTRHGAFGAGMNASYKFYESNERLLYGLLDVSYSYAFKRNELRTFDLTQNGDWSRYLQVVPQNEPQNPIPATQLLTMDAQVTPRDTAQLFAAVHCQSGSWNGELGYNLWWRNSEKVCICKELPNGYGVFDFNSICTQDTTTASKAQIQQGFGNNLIHTYKPVKSDDAFISIKASDMNPLSAAHPRAVSNKIYGMINYDFNFFDNFATLGLGGSYEIGKDLAAMSQWGLWLNCGCSL